MSDSSHSHNREHNVLSHIIVSMHVRSVSAQEHDDALIFVIAIAGPIFNAFCKTI